MEKSIKKIVVTLTAIFFCCVTLKAETVHIEVAGTLKDLLGDKQTTITELTLSGFVNGTDVGCIRAMSALKVLDMKQCTIVAGGESYAFNTTTSDNWISGWMFYQMKTIEQIILPDNVIGIGDAAFWECSAKSVIIPEGVVSIGDSFRRSGLVSIHIPSTVTSIADYGFWQSYDLKEVTFAANSRLQSIGQTVFSETVITSIDIPESVTRIGYCCFQECDELVAANIPPKVRVIEQAAFKSCFNLEKIDMFEGLETIERGAFAGCTKLANVTLPSTLITIGDTIGSGYSDGAFYGTGIETIVVPDKVTMLGTGSFCSCTNLTHVTLPEDLTFLAKELFQWSNKIQHVNIPKSLEKIKDNAFSGCNAWVDAIEIPVGVTEIGSNAFESCSSIPSVTLPEGLLSIEHYAFSNCTSLEFINIPSTVRSLGKAFPDCSNLVSSLVIPEGITSLAYETFSGCRKIPSIQLPSTLIDIGGDENSSYWSSGRVFSGCESLQSIVLPEKIRVIPQSTFENCKSLTEVVLPDSLRIIGSNAFYICLNLKEVKFPEKLRSIGSEAFVSTKLEEIVLNDSLKTIEGNAFYSNGKLKYLYVPKSVTSIGRYAFGNCKNLKSIVYDAEVDIPDNTAFGFTQIGYKYFDNVLLYLSSDAVKVPESWQKVQVIRNGEIESVTFVDSASIYIARPFKTKQINYSRNFTMESGLHNSAGWQSIVLPFAVSRFTHETKGELAPFGSSSSGAKPFWLRELTSDGYTVSSALQANKPYIVSMPNNSAYEDTYNITGVVTFTAEDEAGITIPATPASMSIGETADYKLVPTYQDIAANDTVYALNSSVYNETPAGSAFVKALRDVLPFEAYVVSKESPSFAPAMYSIGGSGGDITALEKILLKEDKSLKIYTQGNTLYIETDKSRLISIYGGNGIQIRSVNVSEGENAINNLPAGIYFLEGKKVIIGN
ncbi:leucine-rich repeat domain-containing protein [Bacteroides nordii]|uniref:leucine-rich repeat domain-containing protein n=1 Tax=Bacteroides nordii TaxID=291645 RepID=UPI002A825759|nr:leucine-rich repeat domain-containing protein [Bacteroides nordii]